MRLSERFYIVVVIVVIIVTIIIIIIINTKRRWQMTTACSLHIMHHLLTRWPSFVIIFKKYCIITFSRIFVNPISCIFHNILFYFFCY